MSGIIGTSKSKSGVVGSSKDTAKAWIRYEQPNSVIASSYNVSSVTNNGTGMFTSNFAKPMANTKYCVVAMTEDKSQAWSVSGWCTLTGVQIENTHASNGNPYNRTFNSVLVFGD